MGWPKNTINVQVVQRLDVHYGWEKGPDAKSERQNCPEAKGITRMVSPTYIVFQGLALGSNLVAKWAAWQITESIATHVNNRQGLPCQ